MFLCVNSVSNCGFFTLVLADIEEFIIRSSSCRLQGRSDGVCQFSAHVAAAAQCFPALVVCKYFSKVCISDQASGARMYVCVQSNVAE
jgi:hypothetical protein